MLKELLTWANLRCFSRKKRADARNIIDTRWVLKFKWEQPTVDANASTAALGGSRPAEAREAVRTIRARLTVRGFKDEDRKDIDRYAGTSSRAHRSYL